MFDSLWRHVKPRQLTKSLGHSVLPLLTLSVLVPVTGGVGGPPPLSSHVSTCPQVYALGAAGSAERDGVKASEHQGVGPEVDSMWARINSDLHSRGIDSNLWADPYPADDVTVLLASKEELGALATTAVLGGPAFVEAARLWADDDLDAYMSSIAQGAALFDKKVREISGSCPSTAIIAVGYSQGAMAIHSGELTLGSASLNQISATVLLGDGFKLGDSKAQTFGTGTSGEGVATWFYRTVKQDSKNHDVARPATTAEVCDTSDIVCDFSLVDLVRPSSIQVHLDYKTSAKVQLLDSVSDWAASLVRLSPSATTAVQVGAGTEGGCALILGGTVDCWGGDTTGELADGTDGFNDDPVPEPVEGLSGVTQISVGQFSGCVVTSGGTVQCWGYNGYGELGDGITTGDGTFCDGNPGQCQDSPVKVSGLVDATQVSANGDMACALLKGGTVHCWGDNSYGELGDGSTKGNGGSSCDIGPDTCQDTPAAVKDLTGVTQISVGGQSACALLADGSVECWGANVADSLGIGNKNFSDVPVAIKQLSGVKEIADGQVSICALLKVGTVDCWGDNSSGELGIGSTDDASTPSQVDDITNATQIATGFASACAVLAAGTIDCWGSDANGQLGDGSVGGQQNTPIGVVDLPAPAVNIATASSQDALTCALVSGGALECWGANGFDLGNGYSNPCTSDSESTCVPAPVALVRRG
jgi:alpha-tubulin suppressor-like RCC1 family protein